MSSALSGVKVLDFSWALVGSITTKTSPRLQKVIAAIPEEDWVPIPYFMEGAAVAETTYLPFARQCKGAKAVRLIVRRVPPSPGSQLALYTDHSYHAFVTNRRVQPLFLQQRLERMKYLRRHPERLAEACRAHRHDHKFLQIQPIVGMGPAVDDIHQRHRQHSRIGPAKISVERLAGLCRRRLCHGQ